MSDTMSTFDMTRKHTWKKIEKEKNEKGREERSTPPNERKKAHAKIKKKKKKKTRGDENPTVRS